MSPTGMPVVGCEIRTNCGSPLPFSSVPCASGPPIMRPNSGPGVSAASYGTGGPGGSMLPVPSPNDPNARLSASPRQSLYGMQPAPGSQTQHQQQPQQVQQQQQQQQPQQYFSPTASGPPVSSPNYYMAGPTAGSLTGQQQASMQQRTPPSGPPLSYPNNAPPGRPQPNSMHFQQHHSQPPGCYSTGPTGRTGCTQSSTGYPPLVAGTDNGASSCRMSSPGPATGLNSTGGEFPFVVLSLAMIVVWFL